MQRPYNQVRYEMIGSSHAMEYFLINEVTGQIYVRKPLTEDDPAVDSYEVGSFRITSDDSCMALLLNSLMWLQISVKAFDLGTPSKESETPALVTVRVVRNENCPEFQSVPYSAQIDHTQEVASFVLQASAADFDPEVPDPSLMPSFTNLMRKRLLPLREHHSECSNIHCWEMTKPQPSSKSMKTMVK